MNYILLDDIVSIRYSSWKFSNCSIFLIWKRPPTIIFFLRSHNLQKSMKNSIGHASVGLQDDEIDVFALKKNNCSKLLLAGKKRLCYSRETNKILNISRRFQSLFSFYMRVRTYCNILKKTLLKHEEPLIV